MGIFTQINDTCLHTHTFKPPSDTYQPFNKPLKSVNYRETWCEVLCHLQRHPHKLEMRGRTTSALSSATGSCQHTLTSPGGVQLGLTSSSAPGAPGSYSCYLSLSLSLSRSNTHKIHKHLHALHIKTQKNKHPHVPQYTNILPVVLAKVRVCARILLHGPSDH